jgi:hypothetical protein
MVQIPCQLIFKGIWVRNLGKATDGRDIAREFLRARDREEI